MSDDLGMIDDGDTLKRILKELITIRKNMHDVLGYIRDAESEVPEKVRRFGMHMNTIHDVMELYTERGQPVPDHIMREAERCDDRMRQILNEAHADGGTFEKVRAKMADDPNNRWDHTRLLTKGPNA
jgi:hypothetical protein